MSKLTIRNLTLGEGRPKICIPMVGQTEEALLDELEEIKKMPFELVGWRVDFFRHASDCDRVIAVAERLREALGDTPMIFTFRSKREGGATDISESLYADIVHRVSATGLADIIDVELSTEDGTIRSIINEAHGAGSKVMLSSQNLKKTPRGVEIIDQLKTMLHFDADLSKVAFMPKSRLDVLTLMHAAAEMMELHSDRPMVAISLGRLGLASRLTAEVFGSVIAIGAGVGSTDQGQIDTHDLQNVLDVIHKVSGSMGSEIPVELLELLI